MMLLAYAEIKKHLIEGAFKNAGKESKLFFPPNAATIISKL